LLSKIDDSRLDSLDAKAFIPSAEIRRFDHRWIIIKTIVTFLPWLTLSIKGIEHIGLALVLCFWSRCSSAW